MKRLSCVLIAFKILYFKIFKYSAFKFNFLRVWYSWREAVKHCLSERIVTMLSQSDSHVIWIHKGKVPTLGNKLFRCSKGPQVKSTVTELWSTHGFQPSGLRHDRKLSNVYKCWCKNNTKKGGGPCQLVHCRQHTERQVLVLMGVIVRSEE